jgi:hypothetical protein
MQTAATGDGSQKEAAEEEEEEEEEEKEEEEEEDEKHQGADEGRARGEQRGSGKFRHTTRRLLRRYQSPPCLVVDHTLPESRSKRPTSVAPTATAAPAKRHKRSNEDYEDFSSADDAADSPKAAFAGVSHTAHQLVADRVADIMTDDLPDYDEMMGAERQEQAQRPRDEARQHEQSDVCSALSSTIAMAASELPESMQLIFGASLRRHPPPAPEEWASPRTLNAWLVEVLADKHPAEPVYIRPEPASGVLPPCAPNRERVHLALVPPHMGGSVMSGGRWRGGSPVLTIDVVPSAWVGAAMIRLALDADAVLGMCVPYPRLRLYPTSEPAGKDGAHQLGAPEPLHEHKTWADYGVGAGRRLFVARAWAHGPCNDPDGIFTSRLNDLWARTPASSVLTDTERGELAAFRGGGRGNEAERNWSAFIFRFHCGGIF